MSTEIKEALKSLPGFGILSDSVLDALVGFASLRTMRAGETIFCQGEPSPYCFGVLSGQVIIQHVSQDRRFPPKPLYVLGTGSLFGESSIFDDSPRAAMASGHTDGKLAAIRGSLLRAWLYQNPEAGQPLLLELLKSSMTWLRQTSLELAVLNGVERLLGSGKPLLEQLAAALEFMKGSIQGLDEIVFYQKNAEREEFCPVMSIPILLDLPSVPASHNLMDRLKSTGAIQVFPSSPVQAYLQAFKLPAMERASVAMVPLMNGENSEDPLQGFLLLSSYTDPYAFSPDKQLILTSISHPLSESVVRDGRLLPK